LVGTVFENTNKPLRDWFRVTHLMLTSKKGMSARQIHRIMGFGGYATAWYMCHRIRAALADRDFEKLGGIVEVDETFVGGKAKTGAAVTARAAPDRVRRSSLAQSAAKETLSRA
jgi:hypothetical protein